TAPTTQIIGKWDSDNSLAPATFITKKAKIANWIISENQFENVITSGTNIFTGISPNGTYAFWAGAGVTGGYSSDINKDAKFSVTKEGKLVARDIKVLGGEIQVGSKFKVNTQGDLEATNVKLSGEIKAASGILGNVEIGGTIDGVTYSGQLLIDAANGSKVEIGKYTSGDITNPQVGFSGIQVTGANGKYVQLDPVNGIIANKGTIAGWTLSKEYNGQTLIGSSINYANNVGFFAPIGTPSANDIMIWAGTSRTGSPGPNFQVTYSGALTATEATIKGSIEARAGYFGRYDSNSKTIVEGWKINGKFIESFSSSFSDVKVKMDGLQGTIAGGNIVGSNMFFMDPDVWYTAYPDSGSGNPGNVDYISSSGGFRLAGGKLTYSVPTQSNPNGTFNVQTDLVASNIFLGSGESFSSDYLLGKNSTIGSITKNAGSFSLGGGGIVYDSSTQELTINATNQPYAKFKIRMNVTSDENGTFGDSTVVQNSAGYLTTGRAFYYGGNNYPDGATQRSTTQDPSGRPFVVGDIWLSRKA
ncbi:hypothetical protein EBU71_17350, partial [bacterium]|nr:hypothetical protein [Candidatus Elulimicrobium humile]